VSDNPSPGTAPDHPLRGNPARPRTTSPVAYGPTEPPDSVLETGLGPVLGPPPEPRRASASRTGATLNRARRRVKGPPRNP